MFEELSMAILGLDPGNPEEIKQVMQLLEKVSAGMTLSDEVRRHVAEAELLLHSLQHGSAVDPMETVNTLNKLMGALQDATEPEDVSPFGTNENKKETTSKPGVDAPDEKENASAPAHADQDADAFKAATSTAAEAPSTLPGLVLAPVRESLTPIKEASQTLEGDSIAEADPEILGEFITETLDHLQNSEVSLLKLETDPGDLENLNNVFRAFHSTKGTSSFLGLNRIKELAHHAEMLLDRARKNEIRLTGVYSDLALESADTLKWMVEKLQDASLGPKKPLPNNYQDLMQRLENPGQPVAKVESAPTVASTETGDGQIIPTTLDMKSENNSEAPSESERSCPEPGANTLNHGALATSTVRVSTEKLDGLINMVGELVITHAMIAQQESDRNDNNRISSRNIMQLEKITRELQDLSMSLRMVPLKATFQKMERLVRDVAKKSNKLVQFKMEGEETEIDRNMVESINDPLVHMLRNAVDHGVEIPEERKRLGKSEHGTVILRAYHTSGNIVIELHDDGKGLDREKIFKKAVEKGLIAADHALTDSEVFKLIFLPGFSTADKVTEVSGRGVGMDVVKKNIESIRGKVEITSTVGQGTVFSIRIPLTLAIIDGMLLKVGPQQYLLPTLNVKQAFRPDPKVLFSITGRGEMVKLRDKLIPIFRLYNLFGVVGAEEDPTKALLLVVEHEGETCALLADALLGQQQLVIKSLPAGVGKRSGSSGAAILGDGRISLILDVANIMQLARGGRVVEAVTGW